MSIPAAYQGSLYVSVFQRVILPSEHQEPPSEGQDTPAAYYTIKYESMDDLLRGVVEHKQKAPKDRLLVRFSLVKEAFVRKVDKLVEKLNAEALDPKSPGRNALTVEDVLKG